MNFCFDILMSIFVAYILSRRLCRGKSEDTDKTPIYVCCLMGTFH